MFNLCDDYLMDLISIYIHPSS